MYSNKKSKKLKMVKETKKVYVMYSFFIIPYIIT